MGNKSGTHTSWHSWKAGVTAAKCNQGLGVSPSPNPNTFQNKRLGPVTPRSQQIANSFQRRFDSRGLHMDASLHACATCCQTHRRAHSGAREQTPIKPDCNSSSITARYTDCITTCLLNSARVYSERRKPTRYPDIQVRNLLVHSNCIFEWI